MTLVLFEQAGRVGRITLTRPQAGNSVTPELIDDLAAAVDAATQSPSRAIVVCAQGANFCLGADVRHLAASEDRLASELKQMADGFHAAQVRLAALPAPIVAAVRGAAVGGGFGLALTSDFLFCSDDARFSTGYARLGLSADAGVSLFLTQALGLRRARALLIDPRFISAPEALELGLAHRTAPADQIDAIAFDFAQTLAEGPTSAFAAVKRLTAAAMGSDGLRAHLDRETLEIVALAERADVAAALRGALDKTKPVFDR
ncbi:MAG TPA: enoyl-CoA hydratase/isomerase family protein [Caulobacteraceae bacterium]|jgi:2-(1,2-epoxy-1,2-dihydrophenyl)acetyl-CoA isomerase